MGVIRPAFVQPIPATMLPSSSMLSSGSAPAHVHTLPVRRVASVRTALSVFAMLPRGEQPDQVVGDAGDTQIALQGPLSSAMRRKVWCMCASRSLARFLSHFSSVLRLRGAWYSQVLTGVLLLACASIEVLSPTSSAAEGLLRKLAKRGIHDYTDQFSCMHVRTPHKKVIRQIQKCSKRVGVT